MCTVIMGQSAECFLAMLVVYLVVVYSCTRREAACVNRKPHFIVLLNYSVQGIRIIVLRASFLRLLSLEHAQSCLDFPAGTGKGPIRIRVTVRRFDVSVLWCSKREGRKKGGCGGGSIFVSWLCISQI